MRLTKLSEQDIYNLLSQKLDQEISAIKSVMARNSETELLAGDVSQIKSSLSTLNFSLENAVKNSSDSLRTGLTDVMNQVQSINVTDNVVSLQSEIGRLNTKIYELMLKTSDDEDEEDEEIGLIQHLLEEIERLDSLIKKNESKNMPYMALTAGLGGGGGAIAIKSEGEIITKQAKCLNFIGDQVAVVPDPNDPDCLQVLIPPPPFALDFINCNPNLVEAGTVVSSVIVNWDWTIPDVINQVLTGAGTYTPVSDVERSRTVLLIPGEDLNNLQWCITAEDPLTGLTDSGCTNLYFAVTAYYGKGTVPTNETEVKNFISTGIQTGHSGTLLQPTSPAPEYMIYAYPSAWGVLGTVIDPATGFQIPVAQEGDVEVTNTQGYKTTYSVYRSVQQTAGAFEWSFGSTESIQLPPSLP